MEFLKEVDQDALTSRFKALDQRRAFTLLEGLFRVTDKMLKKEQFKLFCNRL